MLTESSLNANVGIQAKLQLGRLKSERLFLAYFYSQLLTQGNAVMRVVQYYSLELTSKKNEEAVQLS